MRIPFHIPKIGTEKKLYWNGNFRLSCHGTPCGFITKHTCPLALLRIVVGCRLLYLQYKYIVPAGIL